MRTRMLILALLALLAYLPVFTQPFISDDYAMIQTARVYGADSRLVSDLSYLYRTTTWLATHFAEKLTGTEPWGFYLVSVLLHILNTGLVFALGAWRPLGWRLSFWAAAFFAVYEGHQEAVMWYAALGQLLVFFFGLLTLLLWVLWLQGRKRGGLYLAGACLAYVWALLSKESALALVPLMVLLWWPERRLAGRRLAGLIPFVLLALAYGAGIWAMHGQHHRFHDGSFSFEAPVWLVVGNSFWRLFWVWGAVALAVLLLLRVRTARPLLAWAAVWIVLSLLPYSFLTYQNRVPSRHTYLASVGVSWVVAAGCVALQERSHRRALVALAVVAVLANIGYLWTRKRRQYLERAAPTEALLAFARRFPQGPIYMHCFSYGYPYGFQLGEIALEVKLGRPAGTLIWDPDLKLAKDPQRIFCYPPHALK